MRNIKNKAVRSIIYFVITGGLLFLFSVFVHYTWNKLLINFFEINILTILEATGIASYAAILYLAIRFGHSHIKQHSDNIAKKSEYNYANITGFADKISTKYVKNMSKDELDKLKKVISSCFSTEIKNKNYIEK